MSRSELIRQQIWSQLRAVAKPDSRFDLNFAEYIPDFAGSENATGHITELDAYNRSKLAFITPDNCLVDLRRAMIAADMPFVMSTYGIYRGFVLMEPGRVPEGQELFAAWLDGMEHYTRPVSLRDIMALGPFDLMVTGASAVSVDGVRFGKGHGFFDMEWGMFTDIGAVDADVPIVALVHDVQVVEDKLEPSETDILVDYIATPTRMIAVCGRGKRPHGIKWRLVDEATLHCTPPLRELQSMKTRVERS